MMNLLSSFLEPDQANLIAIMVVSVPLSYILSRVNRKIILILLSATLSFAFQAYLFPTEKYFLWVQQQIVYLLLIVCPRKSIGKIVLIESFVVLFGIQLRRMYISYAENGVDITGIFMMQVFLYIGIAYNYQNGNSDQKLTQAAEKRKICNRPDYLTYMGFVTFLPACLVGPVFEYRDYEDYVNRKGDYEKIPSTFKPAFKQITIFVSCLAIYLATARFELFFTLSEQFGQYSYLSKMLYIVLVILNIEFKYITAWSLGMVSFHISGLSYNAKTNQFDKTQVTKIIQFLFNPSMKIKTESWNMSVQNALRKYIYQVHYNAAQAYSSEKQKRKLQHQGQTLTLMTSAFWHGLYPGYFITFFHWKLYLKVIQQVYRWRIRNKKADEIYKKFRLQHLQNMASNFVIMYFGIFFHLMTMQRIYVVLLTTYAIPFIILYISYILIVNLHILSSTKSKQNLESKDITKKQA